MIDAGALPTVSILRQALDVIRREALMLDVETGGILVGARSEDGDGSMLVTHATPPGPRAEHGEAFFQRDVEYQQKTLNELHRRYGVQYLGEWHKHPRSLCTPSGGDLAGVKELLADSDYGVSAILFPIVICERDLGFQLHPFYASDRGPDTHFMPMKWHELEVALESDRVFTEEAPFPHGDSDAPRTERRSSAPAWARDWLRMGDFLPIPGWIGNLWPEQVDDRQSEPARGPQWYQTATGQQRLSEEQKLLRSFGLASEPFVIADDHLCFSFSRELGRGIVVVCPSRYPEQRPRLLARDAASQEHRSLKGWDWSRESRLIDLIIPLLGPSPLNQDSRERDEQRSELFGGGPRS